MAPTPNSAQKFTATSLDERGVRILAKSMVRELRNGGHGPSEIVAFTNAVLEMLSEQIAESRDASK